MAEHYVRPPLVGHERPSQRLAAWRFRLVLLIAFAALVVGVFFLVRALVGSPNEGNPGVGAVHAAEVTARA